MTNSRHRATTTAPHDAPAGPEMKGGAPGGIWAVAWRQHRIQIAVVLAIVAVGAAALAILRHQIISTYAEFGCDLFPANRYSSDCSDFDGASVWWNYGFSTWSSLAHLAMIAGPIVLGVFAAAPLFTREFTRGTHVFALSQSVSRIRWFTVKTITLVVPLVAGLLVLGYLMEWTDSAVSLTADQSLASTNFFARSIVPAATGLMAFGLAIAIGMLTRNVVTTLVVAILAGGVVLFGIAVIQPTVLPADRTVTPLAETYPQLTQAEVDTKYEDELSGDDTGQDQDWDEIQVGWGYLDPHGATPIKISPSGFNPCYEAASDAGSAAAIAAGISPDEDSGAMDDFYGTSAYQNASNAALLKCMTEKGVVATYDDTLPGSMLWPLRAVISGILVALGAIFTGVGIWRMRWAIAKR